MHPQESLPEYVGDCGDNQEDFYSSSQVVTAANGDKQNLVFSSHQSKKRSYLKMTSFHLVRKEHQLHEQITDTIIVGKTDKIK